MLVGFCLVLWMVGCQERATDPVQTPAQLTVLPPAVVTRIVTTTPAPFTCQRGDVGSVNEIVIGAILPLSKPGAMLAGFGMQTALDLAIEDINAAGGVLGKPLHLITYDAAGLPDRGAVMAERLLRDDCAAILVGVYHNEVALAVKKVAHHYGVPVIFADPRADEITADQMPEVFRVGPTSTMLAQAPGKWLSTVGDYNHDNAKSVVLVVENNSMGQSRIDLAEQWWSTYGFAVEPVAVDLPTDDFSSVIARIVAQDKWPDAVFISLTDKAGFTLQQQMLAAGIGPQKKTLIVADSGALDDQSFWQAVPNAGYTIIVKNGPWNSTVSALGAQFAASYRQYFNHWPEAYAFEAYDTVWLAADAIKRAGTLAPTPIIAALETTNIELASGRYTFPYGSHNPPDGERVPDFMWHQWPDPQILMLQYGPTAQKATDIAVIWPQLYRTIKSPFVAGLQQP